ncbi:hypothetical protein LCGC14_1318210 [marine sediment metagenome]|uniref:Putative DnaT-like domain-containing protein n=1 Tax=marine sediment metagenome TaxID=412755 RepID=A0A0F9KKB2_9ZZZZ
MPSYASSVEAQTYFDGRLNTDAWDSASAGDKTKALAQATAIIDRLNFVGTRTDTDQVNQFPRGTDVTIPQDIKDASAEIALALLDGVNPELEYENINMTSQGYGGIRSSFDRSVKPPHIVAGVPSFIAWTLLAPYLRDPSNIELHRTN